MRTNNLVVVLLLVIFGCDDEIIGDLSGTQTLKGVAVIVDTLSGTSELSVLKNGTIFLKKTQDVNGYLNSVPTNAQGEYSFHGIDPQVNYTVYARIDTGSIKYYGELNYAANQFADNKSDSLKLFASQTSQNGIHLIVKGTDGGVIPNVTAWVFTSIDFWNTGIADGKSFDMVTNSFGIANKSNLAQGRYYIRVKTKIGNIDLDGGDFVDVDNAGIKTITITIKSYNGLEILVQDKLSVPIQDAQVYVYKSSVVADLDSTYKNSVFVLPSNRLGKATIYNIDAATYYLKVLKVVGSDSLRATDNIPVSSSAVAFKPITIIK